MSVELRNQPAHIREQIAAQIVASEAPRRILEGKANEILARAPFIEEDYGYKKKVEIGVPLALVAEWGERPRMGLSDDRYSHHQYKEALETLRGRSAFHIASFEQEFDLGNWQIPAKDPATLVISQDLGQPKILELFMDVTSGETWVYRFEFVDRRPLVLAYFKQKEGSLGVPVIVPGTRKERLAMPQDLQAFIGFLA